MEYFNPTPIQKFCFKFLRSVDLIPSTRAAVVYHMI